MRNGALVRIVKSVIAIEELCINPNSRQQALRLAGKKGQIVARDIATDSYIVEVFSSFKKSDKPIGTYLLPSSILIHIYGGNDEL